MTDPLQLPWHGIPRREIPWFPVLDEDACVGCTLCMLTCGKGVFAAAGRKAEVVAPYDCMVGCGICAAVCPSGAIRLPDPEVVQRVEREHAIFRIIQEQSRTHKGTRDALKARAEAEACLAKRCTRSRIEVAGPDISQAILDELAGLAAKHPVDISDLRLHAPALTGLREGTPSFLSFGVGSTQQEDIRAFFPSLFGWIRRNGLQLIRQTNG